MRARTCVRVLAVPRPASCQCLALNSAKAEPNYRCTATDLAGMLTITEEAAGRGSLGKVTAGRELHKSGPQGQGRRGGTGGYSISGSAALIIYHRRSLGARKQPTIDCRHWWKRAGAERTPSNPTPPAASHPSHAGCSLQNCSKHPAKHARHNISPILTRQHPAAVQLVQATNTHAVYVYTTKHVSLRAHTCACVRDGQFVKTCRVGS